MAKIGCPPCLIVRIAYLNAMQATLSACFASMPEFRVQSTPHETWRRFTGFCAYCGQETPWNLRTRSKEAAKRAGRDSAAPHSPQIDHWIPGTFGGPLARWNVVLSCRDCNIRKGDRIRPYPIQSGGPFAWATDEFQSCAASAIAAVELSWGELIPLVRMLSDCEVIAALRARWESSGYTFEPRFPKLCKQMSVHECAGGGPLVLGDAHNRLAGRLERETERELKLF
jgi:hypothetical protein